MSMYQRINGADWRNIFVVGDLHGCYTLLMSELEKASFDPERDLLISVGDLVDRGAENVECLELITMPWFRAVRGNHEQMMIDGLSSLETSFTGWQMVADGSSISTMTKRCWLRLWSTKRLICHSSSNWLPAIRRSSYATLTIRTMNTHSISQSQKKW